MRIFLRFSPRFTSQSFAKNITRRDETSHVNMAASRSVVSTVRIDSSESIIDRDNIPLEIHEKKYHYR